LAKLRHLSRIAPGRSRARSDPLMIRLCRKYNFRLHIVHLSTAQALDDLQSRARRRPADHGRDLPALSPLRRRRDRRRRHALQVRPADPQPANREQLWQGLRDGHHRHDRHRPLPLPTGDEARMETGRFDLAWGGIASLSVALPVIWTECRSRGFTLDDIVRWMSSAPAALAGISHQAGALEAGRDANFVVFDPTRNSPSPPTNCTTVMQSRLTLARRCAWRRQGDLPARKPSSEGNFIRHATGPRTRAILSRRLMNPVLARWNSLDPMLRRQRDTSLLRLAGMGCGTGRAPAHRG
jgi:hypothetical protein